MQVVIGVRGLWSGQDVQLVAQDLDGYGRGRVAQGQRTGAGQPQPAQHVQCGRHAVGGVEQMADGQIRRQAGAPVATEYQVQPNGETAAVDAEVAEQPTQAEYQGVIVHRQHRKLVVQLAVEVHGLGKNVARPGIGRAVAVRRNPLITQDLAPYL